jgi:Integrase core domain
LYPLSKGDGPLVTYHIDHLGPMSLTTKQYKYIFVIVDAFTKFVWLFPTKTLNAVEVVQKLEISQGYFGNPERIISDKGAAFTSTVFSGDLVAIRRTQFGSGLKLSPKFLGPYEVVKVQGNDRYEVQKCGEHEGPAKTSSSADNMKRFVPCESEEESESENEEMPELDTEIEDD